MGNGEEMGELQWKHKVVFGVARDDCTEVQTHGTVLLRTVRQAL